MLRTQRHHQPVTCYYAVRCEVWEITYHEELLCELCVSSEVIGQSPESSSDHQEAEGQAEEDHDEDNVGSESADEEDEGQDTHEEQPESYTSLAKAH